MPVRPVDLLPATGAAAVRFSLPHRDLHACAQAPIRLLRMAVPARRQAGRPRRSEGRARRDALHVVGAFAEPGEQPSRVAEAWRVGAADDGVVAGTGGGHGRERAIWRASYARQSQAVAEDCRGISCKKVSPSDDRLISKLDAQMYCGMGLLVNGRGIAGGTGDVACFGGPHRRVCRRFACPAWLGA